MHRVSPALAALPLLFLAASAGHGQQSELLEQVNTLRADPQRCDRDTMVSPLRSSGRLGRIPLEPDDMGEALREVDYQASVVQLVGVTGPQDAETALDALLPGYCDILLEESFSDIGIRQEGNAWQLILAQPLIDQDLGDWNQAGRAVLEFSNQARAQARRCGDTDFVAAPPLRWNDLLAEAALLHSRDMAQNNFFSHEGSDGRFADVRVNTTGYEWQRVGENLAAGSGSAEQAVEGWIDSPEHCANLMNPDFTEMGAAYVTNTDSDVIIYWTQVFGTPPAVD